MLCVTVVWPWVWPWVPGIDQHLQPFTSSGELSISVKILEWDEKPQSTSSIFFFGGYCLSDLIISLWTEMHNFLPIPQRLLLPWFDKCLRLFHSFSERYNILCVSFLLISLLYAYVCSPNMHKISLYKGIVFFVMVVCNLNFSYCDKCYCFILYWSAFTNGYLLIVLITSFE